MSVGSAANLLSADGIAEVQDDVFRRPSLDKGWLPRLRNGAVQRPVVGGCAAVQVLLLILSDRAIGLPLGLDRIDWGSSHCHARELRILPPCDG